MCCICYCSLLAALYDGSSDLSPEAQAYRPKLKASKSELAFKQVTTIQCISPYCNNSASCDLRFF